jgi:Domain of unknown function (DUF4129)
MRLAPSAVVQFLVCLFPVSVAVADQAVQTVQVYARRSRSLPEYTTALDRLSTLAAQVQDHPSAADAAIAELRGGWKVQAQGQTFNVSTGWMIDQFEKLQKAPDKEALDRLLQRIGALKADAEAFQQAAPDVSSSRAALDQILARSEFHQVHGPTWLDRLKFKIAEWIFRLLTRFFGSSSAPVVGRIFVWTLVSIAVLVLAFFIFRTMEQNARMETIMPEVVPVSAKQWSVWMAEAQAAAAKGLWRDAIHLAYWAGISFLEERGSWRPDQARTPREYLRLISATSEYRPALSTLTHQLEVTWYGHQQAGPESFAETITHLENLGCRQV